MMPSDLDLLDQKTHLIKTNFDLLASASLTRIEWNGFDSDDDGGDDDDDDVGDGPDDGDEAEMGQGVDGDAMDEVCLVVLVCTVCVYSTKEKCCCCSRLTKVSEFYNFTPREKQQIFRCDAAMPQCLKLEGMHRAVR